MKPKAAPKKKQAKSKPAKKALPRKASAKKKAPAKAVSKATTSRKKAAAPGKKAPGKSERSYPVTFRRRASGSGSAGQSGDLQGLSRVEDVDSESVNELIEEGNAFEADVVQGVTDAGNADEEEVHTHEVPEDDVPEEYLDKD
ncbi:MAG: hypothetical protein WA637_21380 [Terriglobales bacterium]